MTANVTTTVPIGHKHCTSCDQVLPRSGFRHIKDKRNSGRGYLASFCLECERRYKREGMAKSKQAEQWVRLQKLVGTPPCDGCFRRDRCAVDPIPCWRFDAYVEGIPVPSKSESPDRSELAGLSINL